MFNTLMDTKNIKISVNSQGDWSLEKGEAHNGVTWTPYRHCWAGGVHRDKKSGAWCPLDGWQGKLPPGKVLEQNLKSANRVCYWSRADSHTPYTLEAKQASTCPRPSVGDRLFNFSMKLGHTFLVRIYPTVVICFLRLCFCKSCSCSLQCPLFIIHLTFVLQILALCHLLL